MQRFFLSAILLAAAAFGQTAQDLTFDVASVKPSAPPDSSGRIFIGPPRGGPGTPDPGQITWSDAMLFNVLTAAYDVKPYQISAPDWLKMERYDIVVKVPAGATKEQVAVMWQNLLKERFGMKAHKESKEFQVDELTVAKGGSKLKETTLDPNAPPFQPPPGPPQPLKMGPDGVPEITAAALFMMIQVGPNGPLGHMIGKAQTAEQLATALGNQLQHPVVDKTGLTGKYDFNIEYKPDLNGLPFGPPPPPPGGPGPSAAAPADSAAEPGSNIEAALQQQLGLRLVKGKAPLDFIVVDHIEKTPTEN